MDVDELLNLFEGDKCYEMEKTESDTGENNSEQLCSFH